MRDMVIDRNKLPSGLIAGLRRPRRTFGDVVIAAREARSAELAGRHDRRTVVVHLPLITSERPAFADLPCHRRRIDELAG